MEKVRETFPRLYFLSDNDLLDIMVTSRDPQELVPVVRKCFLGIKSLKFGLPEDSTTKLGSELDAALNGNIQPTIFTYTYVPARFYGTTVFLKFLHARFQARSKEVPL